MDTWWPLTWPFPRCTRSRRPDAYRPRRRCFCDGHVLDGQTCGDIAVDLETSDNPRRGRLRLRRWALATGAFGDLDLDLRDASIDQRRTAVTVLAAFGNVDFYVPEGVTVSISGFTILGHRRDWGCDAGRPAAPAIHVRVIGMAGTIDVWRAPHDLHDSSYSDIFHALEDRPRRLPA